MAAGTWWLGLEGLCDECQVLAETVGPERSTPVWDRLADGGYVSDAHTDRQKVAPPGINDDIGACSS